MTIKESLEQLDEILDKTEESVIKDSFEDIAEVLEIETDDITDVNDMITSIRDSVSSVDEDDLQEVVAELANFFEASDDDEDEDDEDDEDDDDIEEEDLEEFKVTAAAKKKAKAYYRKNKLKIQKSAKKYRKQIASGARKVNKALARAMAKARAKKGLRKESYEIDESASLLEHIALAFENGLTESEVNGFVNEFESYVDMIDQDLSEGISEDEILEWMDLEVDNQLDEFKVTAAAAKKAKAYYKKNKAKIKKAASKYRKQIASGARKVNKALAKAMAKSRAKTGLRQSYEIDGSDSLFEYITLAFEDGLSESEVDDFVHETMYYVETINYATSDNSSEDEIVEWLDAEIDSENDELDEAALKKVSAAIRKAKSKAAALWRKTAAGRASIKKTLKKISRPGHKVDKKRSKSAKQAAKIYDSFYIEPSDLDLNEDVDAMFQGEELSEELRNKARTIFEAAVVARVNNKVDDIVEEANDVLEERVEKIEEEYGEKVDEYLTYTVNEWVKDNKLAIESGIRSEMYESFISGMRKVFDDHYINFPEEEISIAEDLQKKVAELEKGLDETLEENSKLHREITTAHKQIVIDDVTDGLSETQKDKLIELYENVEVDSNDENFDKFRANAVLIRESYFPTEVSTTEDSDNLIDDTPVDIETLTENHKTDSVVDNYVKTLDRYVK